MSEHAVLATASRVVGVDGKRGLSWVGTHETPVDVPLLTRTLLGAFDLIAPMCQLIRPAKR
jgi:hypothetical protein